MPFIQSHCLNQPTFSFGLFLTTCYTDSFIFVRYHRANTYMNNCIAKTSFSFLFLLLAVVSVAQTKDTTAAASRKFLNKLDLSNRPNDHFMLQYGFDSWGTVPDSIHTSGFSRHFNLYAMVDKPIKDSKHLSIGIGIGIGSSNIFFKNTYVNLKSQTTTLPFTDVTTSSTNHYSKFKLTTIFAELPVELRYAGDPVTPDKGFKAALGLKIGTLLNQHTKGKNALDGSGKTIFGNNYIIKEDNKRFINSTRVAATARIGFGNISLDGSYQITNFLKTGVGPAINPYSVGITLSGL